MKDKILKDVLKINNNIIIPDYLLKYRDKLDLELDEFILLVFLINQKDLVMFDINSLSSKLYMESNRVLELISSLNEKNYISIEMKKTNGVIEEFISTELFFNKIESIIMSSNEESDNNDVYSLFESEFGRTLSPTETQIIGNWIESDIPEVLIKEALKEAVLSGVHNMRYIDKILFEWTKKGYKEVSDIKRKPEKDEKIEEIYDYDWLNE
ncbi:MAG: DnaD domain protein [Bacilli bacterium]|nr:DnaD domain protein [Bacilli bacterium]